MPVQYGIQLEKEILRLLGSCEIIVPSTVQHEIENLEKREGEMRAAARVAKDLVPRFTLVPANGHGDTSIVELARKTRGIVVTNDNNLRKTLRGLNLPVIYLRGKKRLELEGWCE